MWSFVLIAQFGVMEVYAMLTVHTWWLCILVSQILILIPGRINAVSLISIHCFMKTYLDASVLKWWVIASFVDI